MKLGSASEMRPFASGIIATAYPHASASFSNAGLAFAIRTLDPATRTGFTAAFIILAAASTAASKLLWLDFKLPIP
jgi:hypothetical protein